MVVNIQNKDIDLLKSATEPANFSAATLRCWKEALIKAKTSIIPSLGPGPLHEDSYLIRNTLSAARGL